MPTRVTLGAICLRSSTHLPPIDQRLLVKPVTLSPGRAKLPTKPSPTGSDAVTKTIGIVRFSRRSADTTMPLLATMTSGLSAINSFASGLNSICVPRKAIVDLNVSSRNPAKLPESSFKCRDATRHLRVAFGECDEDANNRDFVRTFAAIAAIGQGSERAAK